MGKIIDAWRRAAIYDPETGIAVQFNRLSPDESEWSDDIIQNETSTGLIFGGHDFTAVIGFMEADGIAQLDEWMEGGTPVRLAVHGAGQDIIWMQSEELLVTRGVSVNARDGVTIHSAQLAHVGFKPEIFRLTNKAIDARLADDDVVEYEFPIVGVPVKAAADYSGISGNVNLTIEALDDSDTVVATDTVSASSGRVEAEILTPADTFKIRVDFSDNSGSATIANKTIRSDGKSAFVPY